jgi:type II secretory pathway component PulF
MGARTTLARAYFDLATLLDAGVPILRSLDVLIEGRKGHLKRVLSQIREAISQGTSLAEALDKHGRSIFPELDRMLLDTADTAGSLPTACSMLSGWHEFMHKINRRIQLGLIYPFLVLHIGAFVAGLVSFMTTHATVTQSLLSAARILMIVYVPTILVLLLMRMRERVPLLCAPMDFILLKIPLLGSAVRQLSICRYAKAFAMLYSAGVPMTEVTERAVRATGNVIVAGLFAGARDSVRKGSTAWEGYSRRLPPEYLHLFQIGEETGDLDKTVSKIAEISGDRADLLFTQFAFWMPWFVYACIAAIMIVIIFRFYGQLYGNLLNF